MKIKFPNPNDYTGDIDGFLDQLELCVHHARKSWDKTKKNYSEEELANSDVAPYAVFRVPYLWEKYDTFYEIVDGGHDQNIEIEIATI